MNWIAIAGVGIAVGSLAGLFGKGGSAIATPLLGVPAIVAVAAPLPATILSTVVASAAYRRSGLINRRVVVWSAGFGVPATIAGALATRWIDGALLMRVTDVVVAALGIRFLAFPPGCQGNRCRGGAVQGPHGRRCSVTGAASGLLANSGGSPPRGVVRLPLKVSSACSLAVSAVLAAPGTVVHAALGHIDWAVVAVFGTLSVPLSYAVRGSRSEATLDDSNASTVRRWRCSEPASWWPADEPLDAVGITSGGPSSPRRPSPELGERPWLT